MSQGRGGRSAPGAARQGQFGQGIAGIDEKPPARDQRRRDARQGQRARRRVAAVQRADPQREGQIERRLAGQKRKLLGRDRPEGQRSGRDLCRAATQGLGDGAV